MEKWLAFGMFKFLIHVCANVGDKGNIQCPTLQIDILKIK